MANRRSSSRLIQSSLVLLRDVDGASAHKADHYWTIDVSAGGLAVKAPDGSELEEEAIVLVELPLGTSKSRIKTRCRVREITQSPDDGRIAHLAFIDESPLFQKTLDMVMDDFIGRAEAVDGQVRFRGEWW